MRILTLLSLVPVLNAQSGGAPWNDLRSKNPVGFGVTLRLVNPHVFRQGELIAVELNLRDQEPVASRLPSEQWQFTGMLLDPQVNCGIVAKPCSLADSSPGGLTISVINGPHGRPDHRPLALNSYLPLLPPGRYHAAALARKLVLGNPGPGSTSYIYADPPQYAVSDAVQIDIVAATADWVRQTIAINLATFNKAQPPGSADFEAQEHAAQQLAFLNDPAAWTASLALLPKEENVLLEGLARGRPQTRVCELMQARVSIQAQSVSTSYLYRMTEICARANLPPPPIPAATTTRSMIVGVLSTMPPPANAPIAAVNPELQAWSEKRHAYTEDLMSKAAAALAVSLASKQPQAKWDGFSTLLERISQVRNNRPPEPDPAWIPLLTKEFAHEFPTIEATRKQYLLDMCASTIDSPELAPLLENVLDSWKPGDYYEAAHSALRGLYRLDPARARARILVELVKERTWLDVASLEMLPASAVPPMDDALIESLARAQLPGGWNPQLSMAAIARYATPKALPRVRAIYESQQDSCQPELMAYFVRVDPAYSERVFRSHAWDMHTPPPRCTVQYFNRTPPLAVNPALERYLTAYLMHSDVYIKSTAAQVLARYGSQTALEPLWEAFRYFHDYWKGKGEELTQNGQGVGLEIALRNAIARGRGWLATETDLHLIESLCISGRCIEETRQDQEYLKPPLRIEITPQSFGISGRVAQYYGIESVSAMESKLAQFPRGTQFVLCTSGTQSARIPAEIRRFAAEKDLVVTTP